MKYFKYQEFLYSQTAQKLGIANYPFENDYLVRRSIVTLCNELLIPIREYVGRPVIITSGYRCERLNKAVGGVNNSQHLTGQAADFIVQNYTKEQMWSLFRWMQDNLRYDQIILYKRANFIHCSFVNEYLNRHNIYYLYR